MEILQYNGKEVEVHTGIRGGKYLAKGDKKRYLTAEQRQRIVIKLATKHCSKCFGSDHQRISNKKCKFYMGKGKKV